MPAPAAHTAALLAALLATVLTAPDCACARIAVPTSDYNALDTQRAEDADVLKSSAPAEPGSGTELGAGAGAGPGETDGEEGQVQDSLGSLLPWTLGAVRVMRRVYLECRDEDLSSCLKVQIVRAMDRAARTTRRVALMAGVTLERDPEAADDQQQQQQQQALDLDLESTLPRSLPERERSLDKLIMDRIVRFFQNYSLRLKLPSVAEISNSVEDARRRRQPFNGLLATGLMLGGSLLPMKLAMLAALAGKALMLSKLALLISALMAMRHMGGGGGGGGHGHGHGHGHH